MKDTEPVPLDRLTIPAVAVLLLLAACGDRGETTDASSGAADSAAAEAAEPAPASGLAVEPVLWTRTDLPYEDFRPEPLRALHAELVPRLGESLLFRVVPYVDRDEESGEWFLKGETLEVSYQETEASLETLRRKADDAIAKVRESFPDLDDNDSLEINARLPDGTNVADLEPELDEACGSKSAVRTGLHPASYVAGELDELYYALCDGPALLTAQLQDPRMPFVEENWTPEPQAP